MAVEWSRERVGIWSRIAWSGRGWALAAVGAQAMLDLRATYLNGEWNAFWPFHVTQEDQRLYGKIRKSLGDDNPVVTPKSSRCHGAPHQGVAHLSSPGPCRVRRWSCSTRA